MTEDLKIRITKPLKGGTVRAIASKSEAHRLLLCAALASAPPAGECFVACPDRSEDIDATARCLEALGAELRYENEGFFVRPIGTKAGLEKNAGQTERRVLDCGESGATLRFLLPVCGALGLAVSFDMKGRLSKRPLSPLIEEMAAHGCALSRPTPARLDCEGRLSHGSYTLPGDISSQFVSGLLFALPLLNGDSVLRVTGALESRPYVDMTLDALRLFGFRVLEEEACDDGSPLHVFAIPGGQSGSAPPRVRAGGDWSNAAFWLSAGAIGKGAITCTGLDPASRQGDRAIVELLEAFGAHVSRKPDAVTVSPGALRGTDIDAGNTPDLVPVLAAVASVAEGKTTIRNAGRLRIKESDRLRTVTELLSSLGADIMETEDGLVITGKKSLAGGETESYGDHRIAMCAAVLSSVCDGPVVIRDAQAVRKSYPGFFEDFSALGAQYEYLR
ncbi:MAG: 3-phosphoshikimate 1-carboxyvinyltransferase [Treponema sp.]|nr:3-phosphoshikimate 1-carboxyvinyltransferase [Treponema sp.]